MNGPTFSDVQGSASQITDWANAPPGTSATVARTSSK
jgi:hypothetical protein